VARETLLSCDSCGRKHGGKVTVFTIESRRPDRVRWMVDLCKACVDRMNDDFGWRPLERAPRKQFTVYDEEHNIRTNGSK
jgi:hypothetical protein